MFYSCSLTFLCITAQLGLVDKSQSAKLIDGRLECKFSRWISIDSKAPDAGRVFTLRGEYYLLLANGPVDDDNS
jgi:hypothetical protein